HKSTNQDLVQLASTKGLTPETVVTGQQAEGKVKSHDLMTQWSKLSGAAFDREYMSSQVRAHEKAESLFKKEASNGSDPDLRAFAEKALPGVRGHLKLAREVASKVGALETRSGNNTGAA